MKLRIWIPFVVFGVALGQGPNQQPPLEFGALKAYLNLTDAQVQQIRQAGEQARKQMGEKARAIPPQIQEKEMALRNLLAKGTDDPTAVGKLVLELETLKRQAHQMQEAPRNSVLGVLTPEQKIKFKFIEDAAMLPAAAREAMMLGLVPRPPGGPDPNMPSPNPGMRRQGQGPGPNRNPGPAPCPPCPCQPGR